MDVFTYITFAGRQNSTGALEARVVGSLRRTRVVTGREHMGFWPSGDLFLLGLVGSYAGIRGKS